MKRRDVLKLLRTAAAMTIACPLVRERRTFASSSVPRSRFYLQIIPHGGMDAVYTTDPKKVSEVDKGIDVPFAISDIVEANGMRFGPPFRALAPWSARIAVINAFRQNSANHTSGTSNVQRFKSTSTAEMPTLLDILGSRRRHGEAIGAVTIGSNMMVTSSPQYLGEPCTEAFGDQPGLFDHFDNADSDDLVTLAKALRRDATSLNRARSSSAEKVTANNLLETAELLERFATSPKFVPVVWAHEMEAHYRNGRDLQSVLWLFEHGLTRCATVFVGDQDFDTHVWNVPQQPQMAEYLAFLLDRLFTDLVARSVDGQRLVDQTTLIVGSEIGRFPRLNTAHGKDHFPQVPHIFAGPGFVTGATYGATGRNMASVPISLMTGRPEADGHLLRVDDIGTTLLNLDGATPEFHGYTGEHLKFLTG
jgi:hypothetical protein